MIRHLLIALQFLTIIPVRFSEAPEPEAIGRSLCHYPLVGLLIGLLPAAIGWLLGDAPANLSAAVALAAWVAITGALHLDGLADSADGAIGGLGDRDKTLAIMKDARSGPMAVVVLALVLLTKHAALSRLIENDAFASIVLAPVLGRTALILLFLTTPYVRDSGLGSPLANHLPKRACAIVAALTPLFILLFYRGEATRVLVIITVCFFTLRHFMLQRIGGATGDTAGASVEIIETVALLAAALQD